MFENIRAEPIFSKAVKKKTFSVQMKNKSLLQVNILIQTIGAQQLKSTLNLRSKSSDFVKSITKVVDYYEIFPKTK